QRAADQLGGSAGITLYIGLGFSGASFGIDPFLLSSAFAIIGLIGAGLIAMRISMPRHGAEEYAYQRNHPSQPRDKCSEHRETVFSALAQRSDRPTTRPAGYILLYSNQHDSIVNKLIFASTSRYLGALFGLDRGLFH